MSMIDLLVYLVAGDWCMASINDAVSIEQVVNGSTSSYFTQYDFSFTLSPAEAGLSTIVGIFVVAAMIGLNILGSGLSDESVETMIGIVVYAGIWATLSIISGVMILSIPIFGVVIYFVMTLVYTFGVIQKVTGDS